MFGFYMDMDMDMVGDSFRCDAIASPSFASLFETKCLIPLWNVWLLCELFLTDAFVSFIAKHEISARGDSCQQ